MDVKTKVTVANLLRAAVKYMDKNGWQHQGSQGFNGEVCPVAAVVYTGQAAGYSVRGPIVKAAVEALDDAAAQLPAEQLSTFAELNSIARYNEHPDRNAIEVKNFMGHVANQLVKSAKPAPKKKVVKQNV